MMTIQTPLLSGKPGTAMLQLGAPLRTHPYQNFFHSSPSPTVLTGEVFTGAGDAGSGIDDSSRSSVGIFRKRARDQSAGRGGRNGGDF